MIVQYKFLRFRLCRRKRRITQSSIRFKGNNSTSLEVVGSTQPNTPERDDKAPNHSIRKLRNYYEKMDDSDISVVDFSVFSVPDVAIVRHGNVFLDDDDIEMSFLRDGPTSDQKSIDSSSFEFGINTRCV